MKKQKAATTYVHRRPTSSEMGAKNIGKMPKPHAYNAIPPSTSRVEQPSSRHIDAPEIANAEDEKASVSHYCGKIAHLTW